MDIVKGDISFSDGKPIFIPNENGNYRQGMGYGLTLYWKDTEQNPFDTIQKHITPVKQKRIGMWGQDLDECDEFSKSITKNAGPRD